MSLLDQWLVGPQDIPFEKSASFMVELRRPTAPGPLPPRTPQVQAGQLKIAALVMNKGVDALPELERRAMTDPDMQAAIEFEQTKAHNAELEQQLQQSQAQLAAASQQAQATEQQLMQQAEQQQQMQAQLEQQEMEKQQLQEQTISATQASLSERMQSVAEREQLAQAATDFKAQLENLAAGAGQLRDQAAQPPQPPMGQEAAPLPEPDPTAPADVRKEQEQAQKAELEADQQKAQADIAEQQKMEEQAAQAPPAPAAPPGQEAMAPAGPGGPVAGAPQVPTPAGGALKMGSEKPPVLEQIKRHAGRVVIGPATLHQDLVRGRPLGDTALEYRKKYPEFAKSTGIAGIVDQKKKTAAGSTTVELPMSQYPKAPAKSVLEGASAVKLPSVGRVIPHIKKLTDESSKLESAVEPERLKPDAQPEIDEKKPNPELKAKQAAMWSADPADAWLNELGMEELGELPVEKLAAQLEGLSINELSHLITSLDKEAAGVMPTSAMIGALKGGIVGGAYGGLARGAQSYAQGSDLSSEERRVQAIREAAKGAAAGAVLGAAMGGIGGAASAKHQEKVIAGAPAFHPATGQALGEAQRAAIQNNMRKGVVSQVTHPLGAIGGVIGGLKGPEAAEAMTAKQGSAQLHPRLAKLAETLDQYKTRVSGEALNRAEQRGFRQGAGGGAFLGQLGGGALGYGGVKALGGSPKAQLAGTLIGAVLGTGAGAYGGGKLQGKQHRAKAEKGLSTVAPEHWQTEHEMIQARKAYARGEEGARDRYKEAIRRRAAAAQMSRDNLRTMLAKGKM